MLKKEAEILQPFNTIIREYPDGSIFLKRLNFTVFKKEKGWERVERKLPDDIREYYEFVGQETYGSVVADYRRKQAIAHREVLAKLQEDTVHEVVEDTLLHAEQILVKYTDEQLEERKRKKTLNNIARTRNKIFDIARSNTFNYFITLTFDSVVCDRYSFTECSKKARQFMNNFAREHKIDCPNFKYLIIHEQHTDGAYHYHGLIYLENPDLLVYDRIRSNQYFLKNHVKLDIFNWCRWKNGYSTVSAIQNQEACRKYILKYISKNIDEDYQKGQRHFYYSQNCLKPVISTCLTSDLDCISENEVYNTVRSVGYELKEG